MNRAVLRLGFVSLLLVLTTLGGCRRPDSAAPPGPGTAGDSARAEGSWDLDWARDAVFYEIFVRSFADSDGDGKGDFEGLTAHLDYLNDGVPDSGDDLEVDALWLMPVFDSPSYHGYDAVDYLTIEPDYGDEASFREFLDEAHRRGVRVVLDLMLNHTSNQHPWFRESTDPESPRRDWYVWRDRDPGWRQPWGGRNSTWHRQGDAYYFGLFWGGMPDLNFRNPEVRAEMLRIARYWLDLGVDGFRLDAARHIVEGETEASQADSDDTLAYWREFAAEIRSTHPSALLVGEVWADTGAIARYVGAESLPMAFDFPLASAVVDGVRRGFADGIARALEDRAALFPEEAMAGVFLTNHDMVRVATVLDGDRGRLDLAAALLMTLPGVPFVYYGEEVGLRNGAARGDEAKRTPMPWSDEAGVGFTDGEPWYPPAPGVENANVADEISSEDSLLSRYRRLIRLRRGSRALSRGDARVLDAPPTVLALARSWESERVLVLHNLGTSESTWSGDGMPPGVEEAMFVDPGVAVTENGVTLPAGASAVWRLP